MRLVGAGLEVVLPSGWDGELWGRPEIGRPSLLHLANGPLPPGRGDFGGHALAALPSSGVFVALLESDPRDAGRGLYGRIGAPVVVPAEFNPRNLHRSAPGHVATQRFFTASGRAFCLYAVVASEARVTSGAAAVNQALAAVRVLPLESTAR